MTDRCDRDSVRRLYEEHSRGLIAYACSFVASFATAEDILHQVFERLLRGDLAITGAPVGYLYRAVRNTAMNKIRDRASYAFALVSVAAALATERGVITHVRIALGGVAHKPWRAFEAERVLVGATATTETYSRAAEAELASARGFGHNDFKIELAKRTLVSVLSDLTGRRGTS